MNLKREALSFRKGLIGDRESDLMCRVVCFPLAGWLAFNGVSCRVVDGEFLGVDHSWIELSDGRVLDPTIDQFNGEVVRFGKIYLGEPLPQHKVLEQSKTT